MKTLIHKIILPTDPNKNKKLLYIIIILKPRIWSLEITPLPRLGCCKNQRYI